MAIVVIKPTKEVFSKVKLDQISVEIPFEGGGHGVTMTSLNFPAEHSGKRQRFDIFCEVQYPNGKGEVVRYKEGKHVGTIGGRLWENGILIAGALSGSLAYKSPARIELVLP